MAAETVILTRLDSPELKLISNDNAFLNDFAGNIFDQRTLFSRLEL